jgi:hypothetical protein
LRDRGLPSRILASIARLREGLARKLTSPYTTLGEVAFAGAVGIHLAAPIARRADNVWSSEFWHAHRGEQVVVGNVTVLSDGCADVGPISAGARPGRLRRGPPPSGVDLEDASPAAPRLSRFPRGSVRTGLTEAGAEWLGFEAAAAVERAFMSSWRRGAPGGCRMRLPNSVMPSFHRSWDRVWLSTSSVAPFHNGVAL